MPSPIACTYVRRMATHPECVTCRTPMDGGFIPEATAGGIFVTVWHPGDPTKQKQSWRERLASPAGVRYGSTEVLAIEAYRCPKCGRLDLFAREPPTEGHSL